MTLKVELGFTDAGVAPPYFVLDDPTKGILDGTAFVLGGGEALVDVSEYVRTADIQRGKSRELDRYDAGQASVTFNNTTRAFDPTYVASPFYGQIVPRRRIRISMDGITQFDGVIDDWNIEYDASGYSIASCQAFGGFSQIANLELNGYTPSQELSSDRLNGVLNNINWPASQRNIQLGRSTLAAEIVPDATNALDYMQLIQDSEAGDIFTDKANNVVLRASNQPSSTTGLLFTDLGTGIAYQTIRVTYGSELLYNFVTVSNLTELATVSDAYSIALYGQRDIEVTTLLADATDVTALANYLLGKYREPEFRFEGISVDLSAVTPQQRQDLLNLELADSVTVEMTPSNNPPTITQYGKIISLNYSFTPEAQSVEIGLTGGGALFVLDDPVFGKLDGIGLLGW
jgi:hypothetical protein